MNILLPEVATKGRQIDWKKTRENLLAYYKEAADMEGWSPAEYGRRLRRCR